MGYNTKKPREGNPINPITFLPQLAIPFNIFNKSIIQKINHSWTPNYQKISQVKLPQLIPNFRQ